MTLSDTINIVVSLVSIVIALFALYQTKQQIALSNKQQLFDRRLSCYKKFNMIYSLFSENKSLINMKDSFIFSCEYEFALLTNSSDLEEVTPAISKPLHQDEQNILLKKREDLKNLALEISMVFDGELGEIMGRFVSLYTDLLMKVYQQQIMLRNLENKKQENGIPINLEDFIKQSKQNLKDINIQETINELNRLDKEIVDKNLLEKTKNSLRLTKVRK